MNREFLAWFLISLYVQVISSLALESFFNPRNRVMDTQKGVIREQEVHGANGTITLLGYGSDIGYEAKHGIMANSRKAKHGGANAVHRPHPPEKSASSWLKNRSFFISSLTACVSFALLFLLF